MATFAWKNNNNHGVIEAKNKLHAKILLRKQGINPSSIRRHYQHKKTLSSRINTKLINHFFIQLNSFIKAGIDLQQALHLCQSTSKNKAFTILLNNMLDSIKNGYPLSYALRSHPNYFDALTCQLIELGEHTGTLAEQLQQITQHQQTKLKHRKQLIKALSYPGLVMFVAIAVTALLLKLVVPQFVDIFSQAGSQLPLLTRIVMHASEQLEQYFLFFILAILFSSIVLIIIYRKNHLCRTRCHRLILYIPLIKAAQLTQYCHLLATLLNAGIPINQALKILVKNCHNLCYQAVFKQIEIQSRLGHSLHSQIQNNRLFPTPLPQLIHAGEQTGMLAEMFKRCADMYDQQLKQLTDLLTSLLEPLIIIILAGIVGTIVIALYLPIFNMGNLF